jgi:hypothetical protein
MSYNIHPHLNPPPLKGEEIRGVNYRLKGEEMN